MPYVRRACKRAVIYAYCIGLFPAGAVVRVFQWLDLGDA